MRVSVLVVALAGVGCKKTPEAPRNLDQLSHDVYLHYDDPSALAVDVGDMLDTVLDLVGSEEAEKGFTLTDLSPDEVVAVDHPEDRDFSLLIGAAVMGFSTFPPADHAISMTESSQTWNDPHTYNRYDRVIVRGDADAFADGSGRIDTENDIEKAGAFGVTIPYDLMKDFQWVRTSAGDAVIARSWVEEHGCSENGKNCVMSSFSLEFYYPDPNNASGALRLTSTWIDLVTEADSLLTEEYSLDLLVNGIYDIFENTDAHLAGTLEE